MSEGRYFGNPLEGKPSPNSKDRADELLNHYKEICRRASEPGCSQSDFDKMEVAANDVYSSDTKVALACFEVMYDTHDLEELGKVIVKISNEDVKLEIAKRMDTKKEIIEISNSARRKKTADLMNRWVSMQRLSLQKMIDGCSGEVKNVLEVKLAEFEDAVKKIERLEGEMPF